MIVLRSRTLQAACALALFTGALVAAGCTEKLVAPPPPPTVFAVPDSIQQIFTDHCAADGCHTGPNPIGSQDLSDAVTSYASIVGVTAVGKPAFQRIAPGDSANSYVVMKLRDDPRIAPSQPMPFGSYPLDPALVIKIAAWAQQGAPGVPVVALRTRDWSAARR